MDNDIGEIKVKSGVKSTVLEAIEDKKIEKGVDNKLKNILENVDPILRDVIDEKIQLNYLSGVNDNYDLYLKKLGSILGKVTKSDLEKIGFIDAEKAYAENFEVVDSFNNFYQNSYYKEITSKIDSLRDNINKKCTQELKKFTDENFDEYFKVIEPLLADNFSKEELRENFEKSNRFIYFQQKDGAGRDLTEDQKIKIEAHIDLIDSKRIKIIDDAYNKITAIPSLLDYKVTNSFPNQSKLEDFGRDFSKISDINNNFDIKEITVGGVKASYDRIRRSNKFYEVNLGLAKDVLGDENISAFKTSGVITGENNNLEVYGLKQKGENVILELRNNMRKNKETPKDLKISLFNSESKERIKDIEIEQKIEQKELFAMGENNKKISILKDCSRVRQANSEKIKGLKEFIPELDVERLLKEHDKMHEGFKVNSFSDVICNLSKTKYQGGGRHCNLNYLKEVKSRKFDISVIENILSSEKANEFLAETNLFKDDMRLRYQGLTEMITSGEEINSEKIIKDYTHNDITEEYAVYLKEFVSKYSTKLSFAYTKELYDHLSKNKLFKNFSKGDESFSFDFDNYETFINLIESLDNTEAKFSYCYNLINLQKKLEKINNFVIGLEEGDVAKNRDLVSVISRLNRGRDSEDFSQNGIKQIEFLTLQKLGLFDNKESLRETAKVYQFKKDDNTHEKIKEFSENNYDFKKSSINKIFSDVEIDNATNVDDIKKLDKEMTSFNKLFLGKLFNDLNKDEILGLDESVQKLEFYKYVVSNLSNSVFKTRLLGRHKASGLFYPGVVNNNNVTQSILSVDPRNGYDSYIHEFGHLFDFNFSNKKGVGKYKIPISDLNPLFSSVVSNMKYNNKNINNILGEKIEIEDDKINQENGIKRRKLSYYKIEHGDKSYFKNALNFESKTSEKYIKVFNLLLNQEGDISDSYRSIKKCGPAKIKFYGDILKNGLDINKKELNSLGIVRNHVNNGNNINNTLNYLKDNFKESDTKIVFLLDGLQNILGSELDNINKDKYNELRRFIRKYKGDTEDYESDIVDLDSYAGTKERIIEKLGMEKSYELLLVNQLDGIINEHKDTLNEEKSLLFSKNMRERDDFLASYGYSVFKDILGQKVFESDFYDDLVISEGLDGKSKLNEEFYSDIYSLFKTTSEKKYSPLDDKDLKYFCLKTEVFARLFETFIHKKVFSDPKNQGEIESLELFKKMKDGTWNNENKDSVRSKIAYGSFTDEDIDKFEEVLLKTINKGFSEFRKKNNN